MNLLLTLILSAHAISFSRRALLLSTGASLVKPPSFALALPDDVLYHLEGLPYRPDIHPVLAARWGLPFDPHQPLSDEFVSRLDEVARGFALIEREVRRRFNLSAERAREAAFYIWYPEAGANGGAKAAYDAVTSEWTFDVHEFNRVYLKLAEDKIPELAAFWKRQDAYFIKVRSWLAKPRDARAKRLRRAYDRFDTDELKRTRATLLSLIKSRAGCQTAL